MSKVQTLNLTLSGGDKVKYIGEVVNGYAHGHGKMIYEEGNYEIGDYINNEPNGPLYIYTKEGNLTTESHFKNGKEDGVAVSYNDNKECESIAFYKNDDKHGYEIIFNQDGGLSINKYVNGNLVSYKNLATGDFVPYENK